MIDYRLRATSSARPARGRRSRGKAAYQASDAAILGGAGQRGVAGDVAEEDRPGCVGHGVTGCLAIGLRKKSR